MTGNRWRDSDDPPFSKANLRPATDPQPRKPKPKPRQALKRERTDDDSHPRKSLRKAITEITLADPDRSPQSISDELEDRGYQAPILTVATIRADALGLYPRSRREVPIIAKPKAGQPRPGPNKRIPPARR